MKCGSYWPYSLFFSSSMRDYEGRALKIKLYFISNMVDTAKQKIRFLGRARLNPEGSQFSDKFIN